MSSTLARSEVELLKSMNSAQKIIFLRAHSVPDEEIERIINVMFEGDLNVGLIPRIERDTRPSFRWSGLLPRLIGHRR